MYTIQYEILIMYWVFWISPVSHWWIKIRLDQIFFFFFFSHYFHLLGTYPVIERSINCNQFHYDCLLDNGCSINASSLLHPVCTSWVIDHLTSVEDFLSPSCLRIQGCQIQSRLWGKYELKFNDIINVVLNK